MVVGARGGLFLLVTRTERVVCCVGCDVSHPAPNVKDRPSLVSVVTSYNSTATKYRVYLDCQRPRQEIIEQIAQMLCVCACAISLRAIAHTAFQHALNAYKEYNKKLPGGMIVYRDGVSEGEYWQVMDEEIKAIKGVRSTVMTCFIILLITPIDMIKGAYNNQVQVIFIAVGKR